MQIEERLHAGFLKNNQIITIQSSFFTFYFLLNTHY